MAPACHAAARRGYADGKVRNHEVRNYEVRKPEVRNTLTHKQKRPRLVKHGRGRWPNSSLDWLQTSLSDDLPSYARPPSDVLCHSTTGDSHSNNVRARHSNPAAARPPGGCVHPCCGWLCPISLPPFRWHAGTFPGSRLAPGVPLQIASALPLLPLPRLLFQIDSRRSPLCFRWPRKTLQSLSKSAPAFRYCGSGSQGTREPS